MDGMPAGLLMFIRWLVPMISDLPNCRASAIDAWRRLSAGQGCGVALCKVRGSSVNTRFTWVGKAPKNPITQGVTPVENEG